MWRDVVVLIKEATVKDEIGQDITAPERREVFAEEAGIARTEFFAAGQTGIKPACMFKIRAIDYDGEEVIEHNNAPYKIYRTYPKGEMMELYCERRGGLNGD